MNETCAPERDRRRRRWLTRFTVGTLLSGSIVAFSTVTALADTPTPFQSVYTSRAIGTWALAGGQLTIVAVANRTQTTPGPASWTRAVLVSGSESFCDQSADQWVSRTFDAFQMVDARAISFARLNSARVDTTVTVTASDLRFPNCATPDTSQPVSASPTISLQISARWQGVGTMTESTTNCLPVVCYTVSRFRFATIAGSITSDAPELNVSLNAPIIAAISTFTMVQHPPTPRDDDKRGSGGGGDNQAEGLDS